MNKSMKQILKKCIFGIIIVCFSFSSIFSFPIPVFAGENVMGRITKNDVRLRSKPTTKTENGVNNIILEMDEGAVITILSTEKIPSTDSGCSGWYHINYKENTGYVCLDYVTIDGQDVYDRPWTSPKKAIVGGAKFIAQSYISRGQFTSYLKKFNVNPNGYYSIFNHQYMSNLAAPSSEAKTSWSTYEKNGLNILPLAFNIPVFTNMNDSYDRPGGNLISVEKQGEITDIAFEEELNRQGFPESYKQALRRLHTKYPNWTFTAMQTGIHFETAILAEKNVGAIQGGNQYYELVNNAPVQAGNDRGWYIPNYATTAYYLDPRNFLTETYILQFESLENSANYTEAIIQTILNNTFMQDFSFLDNQTYASIFVEAGKIANVSSVYLASLARQESGVQGSTSTSGNAFTYEGVTYSGLFNFYNIGAKSSASSPVHAGLVYASGGACTLCKPDGDYVVSLQLSNYLSMAGYKVANGMVSGFSVGEKISAVKEKLQNALITIESSSDIVTTGTKISYNGETYEVIVYGDLTGDGQINSADLLKMRQHLQGSVVLTGSYLKAASLAKGSSINSADLLKLRQHLLGSNLINQG